MKEYFIANTSDLDENTMKSFSVEGNEILLSRTNEGFFALGSHCTHYGAPLAEGVISGDRIVCPLHHACFNVKTGNMLEPPAQDSLPKFDLRIEEGKIFVSLPDELPGSRMPQMSKGNALRDSRTFVIAGAGAAGNSAAQALREDGFEGNIVMITGENRLPYDRPNLSKEYLSGEAEEAWMPLRGEDFYKEFNIGLLFNKQIERLDSAGKSLALSGGDKVNFDKLLISSGGTARSLHIPGENLKNVFTLRSFDDADKIIEAGKEAKKALIIGASFIGLETAFSLSKKKISVTVVAQEVIPFERVFGREIGKLFRKLHEENGVTFRMSLSLKEFVGKDKVESVVLENGDSIDADLVVMGVGVRPATDFVSDIPLLADGSIKVDKYFNAAPDIYAAGDVATLTDWRTGEDIRIEHWRTALQQGRLAAHNMAGFPSPYNAVPFFWTSQAGLNLQYVGHAKDWEEIIIRGDVQAKEFIAFYLKNNIIYAVAGNGRDREMAAIEELMRRNNMPPVEKLRYGTIDLVNRLRSM